MADFQTVLLTLWILLSKNTALYRKSLCSENFLKKKKRFLNLIES